MNSVVGRFLEQEDDRHVLLRQTLLGGGRVLPPPSQECTSSGPVERVAGVALRHLRARGVAIVQLGEPLADDAFLTFGSALGELVAETDPSVQPRVDAGVILNLITDQGHTSDVSSQPFATNSLALHSEGSGRPVEQQPRYIVLMCCDPGDAAMAAQTVLVPMAVVERQMGSEAAELLASTRYHSDQPVPMMVRAQRGRTIFSFRDFQHQPLDWEHVGNGDARTVNEAIRRLLAAMYVSGSATGITWKRGMLAVIDNTFYFHGRTVAAPLATRRRRHLRRLRII